jgi:hypothetical protein
MTHHWDEFSKSLAEESLPRRESLRRIGFALAGAVLAPLGLNSARAASKGGRTTDPCVAFCACRRKSDQNQCLRVCRACRDASGTLLGSCGNYFCCAGGESSCGSYCADLANDPSNCGACGYVCAEPRPYEYGACIDGECRYTCAEGAVYCDGFCTFLGWDPYNCGACGNVCPESAPYCNQGECSGCPSGTALCGGQCVDLLSDPYNCGACGNVCDESTTCSQGVCNPCVLPFILCGGVCVNPGSDSSNCGACGNVCPDGFACSSGACWDPMCQFVEC